MTACQRTEFASPSRQDKDSIRKLYQQIKNLPHVKEMCEAAPNIVMFLNSDRQIVFSNQRLLELTGLSTVDEYLGLRPGELFHCIHANSGPSGCGTGSVCQVCGAVLAVLKSQQNHKHTMQELRLTSRSSSDVIAFDFNVSAAPFSFENQILTIVNLIDISDQKRRRVLERIFFHDILNTAGSLLNLTQTLSATSQSNDNQDVSLIHLASKQLVEEIKAQRELMEAENNELKINFEAVHSLDCLKQAINLFIEYQKLYQIQVKLAPDSENTIHYTDVNILSRVLSNLVKNALEACCAGQTVTVGCCRENETIQYWVKNQSAMSHRVQLQIFQRSFTTKGTGRGLGTYSILLLTEKFLKGNVSFESSESEGTCFKVQYPIHPNQTR